MAVSAQKQTAVRALSASAVSNDRARSKAFGAIRSSGNSRDMMDITNLEDFQFDDSSTVLYYSALLLREETLVLFFFCWILAGKVLPFKDFQSAY